VLQLGPVAGLVALVLVGFPVGALGGPIGMQDHGATEPAEDAATDPEVKHLELFASAEAREQATKEFLGSILAKLHCMAFQRRFDEEPAAGPGLGERGFSDFDFAALFKAPEVYRSGVDAERLRALAARIAGTDRSGTLDGSRAKVRGLPPPLAVSGWGSPNAPLIAYVPRAETPFVLEQDMSGAGALVVDGDLSIWGSFHYAGLLLVLGDLVVVEDAEVSLLGLPLFSGALKVHHRGGFQVRARKTDFTLISKTLRGRVPIRQIPLPRIERVAGPTEEQGCAPLAPRPSTESIR